MSHSGDRADGDFLQSLNVTDIHTTWVETCAVMGKSQVRVQEALEHLRQALPFALRGIDSDNGLPQKSRRQSFSDLTTGSVDFAARRQAVSTVAESHANHSHTGSSKRTACPHKA